VPSTKRARVGDGLPAEIDARAVRCDLDALNRARRLGVVRGGVYDEGLGTDGIAEASFGQGEHVGGILEIAEGMIRHVG